MGQLATISNIDVFKIIGAVIKVELTFDLNIDTLVIRRHEVLNSI